MSRRSTAEEKTTKFDPIYRNRLVNMLVNSLAIRWLLGASRKRLGRNMAFKLCFKLVDAANGSGDAIRKMEETHRMAEANRAFAHFH
ncbi:hypothetical protein ERO13_D02G133700v2 [Gossypium hirsutum]|uniref:Small ribosomal subunit protein uS7 domain-containing protein n=3 Tax=Gossypium TaxID=3633 RepID=A0A5J5SDC1_GOSBA|nr:hypothetical protein ES319_D02G152800v1 [Gossypium barbadense]KAG4158687.1 hypothetical protein ERO13_D02G133700v2 [Gossypium hirsutum]TYH84006.1 hypothetical protein ES332_D02G169300v1 [Gossypium tomentosum]TYI93785.1 hypothetical protein E1A91_D02G158600v1 [Gossypium mustelinum]